MHNGGTAGSSYQRWQLLLIAAAFGCAEKSPSDDGGWRAEYDTVGDTIIVRTVSGSVWGDIAVLHGGRRIQELFLRSLPG
jgi:hypothetical protein